MDFKVRFLKYESDDFLTGRIYDVVDGIITDETGYKFSSWGYTFQDLKKWFEEDDDSCEVELVTDESSQFTESDLKDGMVVTYRDGNIRLLYLGILYEIDRHMNLTASSNINDYNGRLLSIHNKNLDIVKVEYMGEILWEREKEYMTLEEAYKTGKKFKRKGINWWYTDPMEVLSNFVSETGKNMFEVLELKEFEIEES